jgi:hypothetical protein
MPSSVTFRGIGTADPEKAIADLLHDVMPTQEAMLFAGYRQITRIRTRTEQGIDVNGAPFADYSSKYKKVRLKRGRNTSPVDLTMSGRLMTSMQVEVRGKDQFAITVLDAEAAAYGRAHNEGLGHMPRRRFFDTSDQELMAVRDDVFTFDRNAKVK